MKSEKKSREAITQRAVTKSPISELAQWLMASAFVFMALGGMIGCGGFQTNPTSEYSELADSVPPHNEQTRQQAHIDSAIFQLETERNLIFVQGRSESFYIKPRLLLAGVEFNLSATNLPEGATLTAATDRPGQYKLTWAPRAGTLTDQEVDRTYKFQVKLNVTKTPDERAANVMRQIGHPRDMELRLVRLNEQAVIEKVELAANEVQEGSALAFTVTVKDLASYEARLPRLFADDEDGVSLDATRISAGTMVRIARTPEVLGEGRYKFQGRIITRGVELPAGTAATVAARFTLVVVSPSGLPAPDQIVEFNIIRNTLRAGTTEPSPSTTTTTPAPGSSAPFAPVAPASPATPAAPTTVGGQS